MNLKCNAYILADQLRRRGYQVSRIIHNPDLSCNIFEEIKPRSMAKESCSVAISMDTYVGRSLYGYQDKELPLTILCFCGQNTSGDDLDDHWNLIFASSAKDPKKKQADLESIQRELSQWQDDIARSVDSSKEFKQFAERIAKYQRNPVIVTDPAYAFVSCGGSIPAPEYIDDPLLAALFERKNTGFNTRGKRDDFSNCVLVVIQAQRHCQGGIQHALITQSVRSTGFLNHVLMKKDDLLFTERSHFTSAS